MPPGHPTAHLPRSPLGTSQFRAIESGTAVALVEGPSDAVAVRALARRLGRDLSAEGVVVLALGGATNIARPLERLYRDGVPVSGLCDADEERSYRRAIEQVGLCPRATREQMERLGFFTCETDLEDELIRALGIERALAVLRGAGTIGKFGLYRRQPAHRGKPVGEQLRGFVTNRKIAYARLFVEALDLRRIPRPLAGLLARW